MIRNNGLDPWYISGFVDGEGCFSVMINTEKKKRKNKVSIYRYWVIDFSIHLRLDDRKILESIRAYFGGGAINEVGRQDFKCAHYGLRDRKILASKLIPHFDQFALQAKKRKDYLLWREAFFILEAGRARKTTLFDGQKLLQVEEKRLYEIRNCLAEQRLTGQNLSDYLDEKKSIVTGKSTDKLKEVNKRGRLAV